MNRGRRRIARIAAPLVVAAAVSGSVSGCGADAPDRYAADPHTVVVEPVLNADQVGRILKTVDGAVAAGWAGGDAASFGGRADGPYLRLTAAELALAKKRKHAVRNAPVNRSLVVVPVGEAWPRFFLTVGNRAGGELPVVQVFRSTSARDPYSLWAELSLLPGTEWPAVSTDPAAVDALDPDADAGRLELSLSPSAAVAAYATVLTRGARTKAARRFAHDEFLTQVRARVAEEAKALKEVATVTSVHAPVKGGVLALRLADGSALVIGQIAQKHVIRVKKGSGTVTVSNPDIVALTGKKVIQKVLVRQAVEVVALRVPGPGMGKVTVIAAAKGDVKVSGA